MIFIARRIVLTLFLSCFSISLNFCMHVGEAKDDARVIFYPAICSYLEADAANDLKRLAIQLDKLGISIMDFPITVLGDTAPHYAIRYEKIKCLKMLLTLESVKISLEQKNDNSESLFDLAATASHPEIKNTFNNNAELKRRLIEAKVRNLAIQ